MKRYLLFLLIIATYSSCSIDDGDDINFSFEILPVDSFVIPEEFRIGETYEITVNYIKPNSCYEFNDFYFLSNTNERTIAVINSIDNNLSCPQTPIEDEATFNFFVNGLFEHYVFKFWQGTDAGGNDIFSIVEVPVVE